MTPPTVPATQPDNDPAAWSTPSGAGGRVGHYDGELIPRPTQPTRTSAIAHVIVATSRRTWALACIGSVTAGIVGLIWDSGMWLGLALTLAFIAAFCSVAATSDDNETDLDAIKAAWVVAGAAMFVAVMSGTLALVWAGGLV